MPGRGIGPMANHRADVDRAVLGCHPEAGVVQALAW